MSKKSNPTLIGAFVVGAVALLALGVAVLGGAELFAKKDIFVAYFDEKTQGLRVGSNVTMNGVQIGHVSGLVLIINRDSFQSTTAVTMEIRPKSWIVTQEGVAIGSGMDNQVPFEKVIKVGGLRARLQSESLVTGQLQVDMSFQPETKVVMRGGTNPPHPEIPTIPSNIERIMANTQQWLHNLTEDFDAKEFSRRVQSIAMGIDELANSQELRKSLAGANRFLNKEETQQVSASLQEMLTEFRNAASDASSLMRNADAKLDTDLNPLIKNIAVTLDEAQEALAAAKFQLSGESEQIYQLGETLREVEAAARAMREFLDYMERNPESVLKGKKQ
jgi:phospholipid/cholesterol/gamma-HCH transport system substrate-binding protein